MKCRVENVQIRGVAAALPSETVSLQDFSAEYGADEVARIVAGTGIQALRVAPSHMTTSDLCEAAARRLFDELNVEPAHVDGIVFVSQTPDYVMPATSVCLQHRLGLSTDAPAFDIAYGCSGYVYGLFQAALLISSGSCEQVLLCAGDTMTRYIHRGDRPVRMAFGDGGSATLVTRGTGRAVFVLHSDGSGAERLIIPAGACRRPRSEATSLETMDEQGNVRSADHLFMDGFELMKFAMREVPRVIDETLDLAGWRKESVGLYGLHQTSTFMVNYLAKAMGLPEGAAPAAMGHTGNTGPASIPLLLVTVGEVFEPERRRHSVLCGFGVGFSWGACAVDLSSTILIPPLTLQADPSEREHLPMIRDATISAKTFSRNGTGEPLLGSKLPLAVKDTVFETWLGPKAPVPFEHHRVFDHAVLPASAFLAMAHAAATLVFGSRKFAIADLVMGQALILPDQGIQIQTVLAAGSKNTHQFRISSHAQRSASNARWATHASGRVIPAEHSEAAAPRDSLASIRGRLGDRRSVEACYDQFRERRALDYGESFRPIQDLYSHPGEALGRIGLPLALAPDADKFGVHPVLLDGAIQLLMIAFPDEARQEAYLPLGVESFDVFQRPGASAWAHARMRSTNGDDGEILTGDVCVFDGAGDPVLDITGVSYKRAASEVVLRQLDASGSGMRQPADDPDKPSLGAEPELIAALHRTSDADRLPLLVEYVRQLAASALRLKSDQIASDTFLNKLGLDSLMALGLRNQVGLDLSVDVPMVKFLTNLSVDHLAALIQAELAKSEIAVTIRDEALISGEI
jgi:3-oxoacyl-[acyl-carrier-protein] synthase-3